MEETPDSGLAEDIQSSQIDLGAFIWGPDTSTESVSQEVIQGGSQEDSSCPSEAEQDVGLSTGVLPSADWHIVAEEGEHVLGPAPPCVDEELSAKPVPEAECALAACVELGQPFDLSDSEMPAMETGALVKESQKDATDSEEKEKQKIEDSVWAGVETCEKVDAGAIDCKALEGTEKSEEKAYESRGNRVVDLLKTIGKQGQETLNINKEETRDDLRARSKRSVKTNGKYLDETGVLEKDTGKVDMADGFGDRDQGLDEGIQVVITSCEIMQGCETKPANHTDSLTLSLQTASVSSTEDGGLEGWGLAKEDVKKNLIDPPNHGRVHHAAQGCADTEGIQCEAVLPAPRVGRDESKALVLSIKHEVAAQSRADLNYPLETNASRRDCCLCKAEDALIEGSGSTVTENIIDLPRIVETDSWGTNPGQIWQPSLNSAVNNMDTLEFSGVPDGQAIGFTNWFDSINHWPIRDVGGFYNCGEYLDIVEGKKGLEVDSLAEACEEQTIADCWKQNEEVARPLVLGTRSSASPQDNDINSSDLSEDEIANQRYGWLYQEIEPDKEEVLTPVCSID